MPKALKIVLIVAGSIVILALATVFFGTRGMKEMRAYTIPHTDLSAVADGRYEGSCAISRWAITVRVTVKDHIITAIDIVDKKMSNITRGIIEEINQAVIEKQRANLDGVTAASITGKGYLIAIGDALSKAAK